MVTFNVHGKEYKVVFGYGLLTKTDVLDKVQGITDGKERSLQKMISLLPELLLAGLQKKHKEEFGYDSDSEKEAVLDKVCDLLDDYEDEGTEENPKSGFDLYQLLDKELEKNGFLSGLLNAVAEAQAVEKNATKLPQDHKPNWYAKGGLFNGAQVIGIGEAGSEAVLPLENPRTMKKIADSIVSSSDGSMGLTKEEMAKAVAQGVAMAMSMNSGNKNPQYIMNSIILDGSEIAKAVTKAQNDTDSRFKPSPAY